MARRKKRELEEELDGVQGEETPRRSPREQARLILRFAGWTIAVVSVVFLTGFVLWQSEQFLKTDPRFIVAQDGATAEDSPIRIEGSKHASKWMMRRVFNEDRGRSLYDMDPEQRRESLRRVEWVRDATVRRIWPNRIAVSIEERDPVAFVQVASGASGSFSDPISYKPMLIDGDGVVLPLKGGAPSNLPLLSGVRPADPFEKRADRVHRMIRALEELKDHRANISELDYSVPDNLRITYQTASDQVILVLGSEKYAERVNFFVKNYPQIREKLTPRAVLDLTMDGRILISEPAEATSK
jgi:cell division protein FtsQ